MKKTKLEYLTIKETAEKFNVKPHSVYRWKYEGRLDHCFDETGTRLNPILVADVVAGIKPSSRFGGRKKTKKEPEKDGDKKELSTTEKRRLLAMGELEGETQEQIQIDNGILTKKDGVKILTNSQANQLKTTMEAYVKEIEFIREKRAFLKEVEGLFFDISRKLRDKVFMKKTELANRLTAIGDAREGEKILEKEFDQIFSLVLKEFNDSNHLDS
jgi:hypothetical protein